MKDETQAIHLEKMMQKQNLYPEYELALPFVQVRKNSLKKLSKGDILLLGFDSLDMILLKDGKICASVVLNDTDNGSKIKIKNTKQDTINTYNSKKYEILKCSFGALQSRKLEVGHNISITLLNLQEVSLIVEGKNIAKGSLVNVEEEIAVQINKVSI